MRILVTGSNGKLGRKAVGGLSGAGHQVVAIDRAIVDPELLADWPGDRVERCLFDVRDPGRLAEAMEGVDAVLHLAAIGSPTQASDDVLFLNNSRATFNVFECAAKAGITRVVFASSVSILGSAYSAAPTFPRYAPVDEHHPLSYEDAYALSKDVDERTGARFARRYAMNVIGLRLQMILEPGEGVYEAARVRYDPNRHAGTLWGYVDVRDAGRACRLAVESRTPGFHILNISARDTLASVPTSEMIAAYAPDVAIVSPIDGFDSAWSTERARSVIGFTAEYSWRNPVPGDRPDRLSSGRNDQPRPLARRGGRG